MSRDRLLLARLLRQRAELGSAPLFFDEAERRTALLEAARELVEPRNAAPGGDAAPAARRAGATHREAGAGFEASLPDTHDELRELALGCTRCGLCETRTQVVFHDGQVDARVVVIGEAPGANEDRTGLPFVGAAGRLLDLMLASVDLSRERDVYICNVIKCRPPGNRNPLPAEIESCAPYLRKQLEILSPQVLLAVGTFASQWLTSTSSTLGKLRGDVHSYEGLPVVATYHPAALLRRAAWTRAAWEDLQLLRQILDAGDARSAGAPSP